MNYPQTGYGDILVAICGVFAQKGATLRGLASWRAVANLPQVSFPRRSAKPVGNQKEASDGSPGRQLRHLILKVTVIPNGITQCIHNSANSHRSRRSIRVFRTS
jgi:hypothetical protein